MCHLKNIFNCPPLSAFKPKQLVTFEYIIFLSSSLFFLSFFSNISCSVRYDRQDCHHSA